MTTLAQQLNALKSLQKDSLSVPQRARISFLFDSRQATNIDDQTLFYLCKGGVKQLQDQGLLDLQAFDGDILNEKSLTYYRGQETADTNRVIDEQVGALLKALSPYLLEQPALKIIEYLIRIYEAHIYHKQTLLLAFMPLYETVYFLRICQCLNLKTDQVWGWLHEFAYQGQSVDKQTLVKCLARTNGLVFCLCAEFCLEVRGQLHTKWFGAFLSEVLKQNTNEGLMFSVLPFIAQSLKQADSKDLRVACLLALGQIACRRVLTPEYLSAITRQLLQSAAAKDTFEFDDDLKLKLLTTLLFFTQYQQVTFDQKHIALLNKIPKIDKLLSQLSKLYDSTSLSRSILEAHSCTVDQIRPLLRPLTNLKTIFISVQSLLQRACQDEQVTDQLHMINELEPDYYKQSTVFVLKQLQGEQRQKIINLLGGEFQKFNDTGFSVITALSSQKKENRDQALKSLSEPTYTKSLNQKELQLAHMILLQILQSQNHDSTSLGLILRSLELTSHLSDADYESLLSVHDAVASGKIAYPEEVKRQLIELVCGVQVQRVHNQKSQAWLIFQSPQLQRVNKKNQFFEVVQSRKPELIVQKLISQPKNVISFLVGLFQETHSTFDYSQIAKLLKKIGSQTQKDICHTSVITDLFMPILSLLKQKPFPHAQELLLAIQESQSDYNLALTKKALGASLAQKQLQPGQVDLLLLHKRLSSDRVRFTELMVICAVTSKCLVKKMFACNILTSLHTKGKPYQIQAQVTSKIMIGVVLMLLNSAERQIREQALMLAEAVLQAQSKKDIDVIEIFTETDKPQSVQKRPVKLTPMKSKSVCLLLQDLVDSKQDLALDRNQLRVVLTKHQKLEVFEEILRTILDYPTFKLKQCLIEMLTLPQKHAVIFCMNLSQVLPKLLIQIQSRDQESYLTALAQLISHLQGFSALKTQREILTSLTLPLLKYVVENQYTPSQVYTIFDRSVLVPDLLKLCDARVLKDIFKLYVRSVNARTNTQQRSDTQDQCEQSEAGEALQRALDARHELSIKLAYNTKLKNLFITRCQGVYKSDDLVQCLQDPSQECAYETVIQLQPTQCSKLFEFSIEQLDGLIERFVDNEDCAYLIELCAQIALLAMPSKRDSTDRLCLIMQKVWSKTQQVVQQGLTQDSDRKQDPFDEFMKSDEKSEEDASDDEQVNLLPCLQVTVSVMKLLTQCEGPDITQTTKVLGLMAEYLVEICCKQKSDAVSQQTQIKTQMYHLYQSLLLRTTQKQADTNPYSQIFVCYIQTCLKLVNDGSMHKQLIESQLLMNTVKSAPVYTPLIVFTLIREARSVSITSQNMIDESIELVLARQLLQWSMDTCQDLSCIRETMYLLHQVAISDSSAALIDEQTEELLDFESSLSAASKQVVKNDDANQKRKLIFLSLVIFTQWFLKNSQMLLRLGQIAGTETPTQDVQRQLLHMLLSSYIMREQVTQLMEQQPQLTRLQTAIQQWQMALNQMMSLKIHISLVLEILDMKPLQLKINMLCLLLDKFASFTGQWVTKSPADLQRVIIRLVAKAVEMLKLAQPEQLYQLLLTILARTASTSLPKDLQVETLLITMQHHRGTLQLQTQTILTELALMETYTYSVLDYFHLYLQHTLDGFNKKDELFIDTYRHALLKSLVCITSIFMKFTSTEQLERCIEHALASVGTVQAGSGDPIEMILENISSEAVTHKKLVLQATMNYYATLIQNVQDKNFTQISQRFFTQLLTPVIRRLPQSYITEHHQKFVVFFKQMYGLPVKVPACSPLLVDCFSAFILKLNEETLRPIIISLAKWSGKEQPRKMVFFEIMCGCLQTLREFFVPMVKLYFDQLAQTLIECYQSLRPLALKRTHLQSTSEADEKLLKTTCKLIELNYKYDSNAFLQNDSFEMLCDPIGDLFDLCNLDDYTLLVQECFKPMVLEMDERTTDDNMWQKLNLTLLMKTRSEQWQTRLAVLSVIDHLFEKMRERYLVILNDTIPFISELLEDENEQVELAAKTIVNRIEQLTGESINEYLK